MFEREFFNFVANLYESNIRESRSRGRKILFVIIGSIRTIRSKVVDGKSM